MYCITSHQTSEKCIQLNTWRAAAARMDGMNADRRTGWPLLQTEPPSAPTPKSSLLAVTSKHSFPPQKHVHGLAHASVPCLNKSVAHAVTPAGSGAGRARPRIATCRRPAPGMSARTERGGTRSHSRPWQLPAIPAPEGGPRTRSGEASAVGMTLVPLVPGRRWATADGKGMWITRRRCHGSEGTGTITGKQHRTGGPAGADLAAQHVSRLLSGTKAICFQE